MLIRVFPTKTNDCPNDDYAFFGQPPLWIPEDSTEVHVSCTFTWGRARAEQLAMQWEAIGLPVKIGGVAYGERGEEFVAGRYLKKGITITSRGCPNRCWFCSVWKRDGDIRELPIQDGWEIFDDNLLACSDQHIKDVFEMLKRQLHRARLRGGIEPKLLKPWHVELFKEAKIQDAYLAYDTPSDLEPLHHASRLLKEGYEHPENKFYCYVLCGFKGDTIDKAESRLREVWTLGMFPIAMFYRDETKTIDAEWARFVRGWSRPAITRKLLKTGAKAL